MTWFQKIQFKILCFLIKRHSKELDQFELYRFKDQFGSVYVEIKREAPEGTSDSAYTEI